MDNERADIVDLTPNLIPEFEKAIHDCQNVSGDKIVGETWGPLLYCARQRKMRPQGAAYPNNNEKERKLWTLFDACGPERKIGIGNPCKQGEYSS